jgi:hypothetical protein
MIPGWAPLTPASHESLCLDEAAVLQLERGLAHVPDVALLVLRIPVECPLDRLPVLGDRVPHDRGRDAEDLLGCMRDDLVVGLRGRSADALVMKPRARLERQVTVVDRRDEVRRVDRGRVGSVNRRQLRRRHRRAGSHRRPAGAGNAEPGRDRCEERHSDHGCRPA